MVSLVPNSTLVNPSINNCSDQQQHQHQDQWQPVALRNSKDQPSPDRFSRLLDKHFVTPSLQNNPFFPLSKTSYENFTNNLTTTTLPTMQQSNPKTAPRTPDPKRTKTTQSSMRSFYAPRSPSNGGRGGGRSGGRGGGLGRGGGGHSLSDIMQNLAKGVVKDTPKRTSKDNKKQPTTRYEDIIQKTISCLDGSNNKNASGTGEKINSRTTITSRYKGITSKHITKAADKLQQNLGALPPADFDTCCKTTYCDIVEGRKKSIERIAAAPAVIDSGVILLSDPNKHSDKQVWEKPGSVAEMGSTSALCANINNCTEILDAAREEKNLDFNIASVKLHEHSIAHNNLDMSTGTNVTNGSDSSCPTELSISTANIISPGTIGINSHGFCYFPIASSNSNTPLPDNNTLLTDNMAVDKAAYINNGQILNDANHDNTNEILDSIPDYFTPRETELMNNIQQILDSAITDEKATDNNTHTDCDTGDDDIAIPTVDRLLDNNNCNFDDRRTDNTSSTMQETIESEQSLVFGTATSEGTIAKVRESTPTWNNGLTILRRNKRSRYHHTQPSRYAIGRATTYDIHRNKKQNTDNTSWDPFLSEVIDAIDPNGAWNNSAEPTSSTTTLTLINTTTLKLDSHCHQEPPGDTEDESVIRHAILSPALTTNMTTDYIDNSISENCILEVLDDTATTTNSDDHGLPEPSSSTAGVASNQTESFSQDGTITTNSILTTTSNTDVLDILEPSKKTAGVVGTQSEIFSQDLEKDLATVSNAALIPEDCLLEYFSEALAADAADTVSANANTTIVADVTTTSNSTGTDAEIQDEPMEQAFDDSVVVTNSSSDIHVNDDVTNSAVFTTGSHELGSDGNDVLDLTRTSSDNTQESLVVQNTGVSQVSASCTTTNSSLHTTSHKAQKQTSQKRGSQYATMYPQKWAFEYEPKTDVDRFCIESIIGDLVKELRKADPKAYLKSWNDSNPMKI